MDKDDKDKITNNFGYLQDNIDAKELLASFIQNGIFSVDQGNTISANTTIADRNFALLTLLLKSGPKAYRVFLEALEKNRFVFVVDQLQGTGVVKSDYNMRDDVKKTRSRSLGLILHEQSEKLKLENKLESVRKERDKLRSENDIAKGKTSELESRMTILRKENDNVKEKNSELESRITRYKFVKTELDRILDEKTAMETQLNKKTDELKKSKKALKEELQKHLNSKSVNSNEGKLKQEKQQLDEGKDVPKTRFQEENANMKRRLEELESKITRLQKENDDMKSEVSNLKSTKSRLQKEYDNMKSEVSNLKSEKPRNATKTENKDSEITRLLAEKKEAKTKVDRLASDNRLLKEKNKNLEEKVDRFMSQQLTNSEGSSEVGLMKEIQKLTEEKKALMTRLSKMACANMTYNNPNIADLGDENRPLKLRDKYSAINSDQWTDAYEEHENQGKSDTEVIAYLLNLLLECQEYCSGLFNKYKGGIEKSLTCIPEDGPQIVMGDLPIQLKKQVTDICKDLAIPMVENIQKRFREKGDKFGKYTAIYVNRCVEVCWLMSFQDPPVFIDSQTQAKFSTFNKDHFKHYTKNGTKMDYVVWPPLFLHKNGPLLAKGIAQPI